MKSKLLIILLTYLILPTISAQNPLDRIPNDASVVFSFNLDKLGKKTDFSKIQEMNIFEFFVKQLARSLNQKSPEYALRLLENPQEAGLDYMKPFYTYADMNEKGMYTGLVLPISDSKKLQKVLTKKIENDSPKKIEKLGNYQYIRMDEGVLAWNDQHLFAISGDPKIDRDVPWEEYAELKSQGRFDYFKSALKLKPENSISKNAKFNAELKNAGDFHIWMDYQSLMRMQTAMQSPYYGANDMEKLLHKLDDLYKETYLSIDISLDKGKATSKSKVIMNESLAKWANEMYQGEINPKFLDYIDGENTFGYFGLSLNLRSLVQGWETIIFPLLKEDEKMGKLAVEMFEVAGIFIDEETIYNLLKGDFLFVMNGTDAYDVSYTDWEYDEEGYPIIDDNGEYKEVEKTRKELLPILTAMMSYGNEENVLKIIKLAETAGGLVKEKSGIYKVSQEALGSEIDIYVIVRDGILFFTNDKKAVENKKYAKQLSAEEKKSLNGNFQTMRIYLDRIVLELIEHKQVQNEAKDIFEALKLGKISLDSKPSDDKKVVEQYSEFHAGDKDINILLHFFKIAEENGPGKGL